MSALMTWGLADALAGAVATAIGNFKLHTFSGTAPAASGSYTPAVADALAGAFITAMGDFNLVLFTGTMPATSTLLAGSLAGYTKLVRYQATTVETAKYPIHWDTVAAGSGQAKRLMSQSVSATASASGSATWACLVNVDDDLSSGSTKKRYAFTVGTSGADVNLQTVAYTSGTVYPLTAAVTVTYGNYSTALYGALGTPLVTYSDGVDGIDWDAVATGTGLAGRDLSEGISGTAAATGDQAYLVCAPYADTLASSSSAKRLLLSVGTVGSGAGAEMSSVGVVSGTTVPFLADFQFKIADTA